LLIKRGFLTDQTDFTQPNQVQEEYENSLDPQIGIYRDAKNGPCEDCMMQGEDWKETVIDEVVVFY
jgi:hypothetical protein